MADLVQYSLRAPSVETIQRGRTTTLVCRTYRAGSIATPSSGTVTITDEEDNVVADNVAVTVSGGFATYVLLGSTSNAYTLADGWLIRWDLVMPDGNLHTFEIPAALCRVVPPVPVTERHLFDRVRQLDPYRPGALSAREDYSDTIDDAWQQVCDLLLARGRRPELIATQGKLREPTLLLCLALVYEWLSGTLGESAMLEAERYRKLFADRWASTTFEYDADDDGAADEQVSRLPTWLM